MKPILVIDLFALLDLFSRNAAELLCGGRYTKYQEYYDHLFKGLSEHADLVFFEDGTLMHQKLDVWKERQNNKYSNCIEVMESIYKGVPLNIIVTVNPHNIPKTTMHRTIIEETAKKYGKLIKSELKDCDTEIGRFAVNNQRVLAVLADDTDFLIFPGKWRYFSVRSMNVCTYETMEYSRVALRRFLNLTDDQLIILSSINGNDIVKFDEVMPFHEALIGFKHKFCNVRFPALADFIRRSSLEELVRQLSYHVAPKCLKQFPESVDMYQLNYKHADENDPLLKFLRTKDYFFILEVLKRSLQTFTTCYFDMRYDCFKNYFGAYSMLLRKQIGIVMHNNRNGNYYELVTKSAHGSAYQKNDLTPIYPNISLPSLIEWIDRDNYPQHNPYRFGLLMWTVSDKPYKNLHEIPSCYLLDILVLTFLSENGFITIEEADLVLLSLFAVATNMIPDHHITPPSILNPRAFHIAFLFTKFHFFIEHSLEVTGLKNLTVSF